MKKTIAFLGAASVAALATPAAAQDLVEGTFTGPRVEGIVGYDITKAGSTIDDDVKENDESIDGLLYGVGVGYDIDLGGVVLGAEAEYSGSTAEVEFTDGLDQENFGFNNVETGRDLYLGARLGVRAGDNALIYAKGGYTNQKYNIRSNDGTTEFASDLDTDGYRLGAGAEYALSERSFVKLEYRYSNYSRAEVDFEGDAPDTDRFDVDFDRHQVVAGFGFRF